MRRSAILLAVGAMAIAAGAPPAAAASGKVLAPPRHHGIYRAAFPDFGGSEDHVSRARLWRFERLARRRVAWAYFSNNWFGGRIRFPRHDVRVVHRAGRVPFVRLMARSTYGFGADPNFPMQSIVAGAWDADLRRWCNRAAGLGFPILAEFGTEVNGFWFPWNGTWNGGGETGAYGDPAYPDGPERFRDAFRHIVDLCRARGARNITWFFHVDVGGWPRKSWNTRFANYYPGPSYVDWIGLSDYGPLKQGERWVGFRHRMDRVYGEIAALGGAKPIAVLEYGAAEDRRHPRRKVRWIRRAIRGVASHRWPRIRALSYWHEKWQNGDGSWSNLHIDSSRRALRAYRHGIARRVFVSHARFARR